jgi:hypothetical protein
MTRLWKIGIAVLAVLAFAAVLTFPALLHNVLGLRRANRSDEQARRNILPPLSTPTDTRENAQLFWLSPSSPDTLEPATVELSLSADPQERAKQLITALIEQAPSQLQRTLPADAALLQFYLLPTERPSRISRKLWGPKPLRGFSMNKWRWIPSCARWPQISAPFTG